MRQQYFCTPAPIVISKHVIVGIGGDSLDVQGYLESREPETGERPMAVAHDAAADGRAWIGDMAGPSTR